MLSQRYWWSHVVARAAVSYTPRTGPSTCRSSSTAGICETRRSSWVSVASMAARGSSMNTPARRALQHCRVEASFPHLEERRWRVVRGTTPPPAWLARTLLLSRDVVVARPGGPELRGDASRRAYAHFRCRRVGSPNPQPTSLRRAGLPRVGLILREIPQVYMTF
jgi:hypothetical protein